MLETSDLNCIRGERSLFSAVSFRVERGEMLHVQGANGSGKTTLLRMLCGLTPPESGQIRWRGEPIGKRAEDYRRELYYFGHPNAIKDELTPIENLTASAGLTGERLEADDALAALASIGLASRADLPCRYLSQGQKRRVALARLVNERRLLWILDEPYVALDAAAVTLVAGWLAAHLQRGGLIVLTTHQRVDLEGVAVRSLLLKETAAA